MMKSPYEFQKVNGNWQRRLAATRTRKPGEWKDLIVNVRIITSHKRNIREIRVLEWTWE